MIRTYFESRRGTWFFIKSSLKLWGNTLEFRNSGLHGCDYEKYRLPSSKLCILERFRCFGELYRLYLQGPYLVHLTACLCWFLAYLTFRIWIWLWYVPPKRPILSELHKITTPYTVLSYILEFSTASLYHKVNYLNVCPVMKIFSQNRWMAFRKQSVLSPDKAR
jgi:hypothetical protein